MNDKKMFSTRIRPGILKNLKHLSVDREVPLHHLLEEAIVDLLGKYGQQDDARFNGLSKQ